MSLSSQDLSGHRKKKRDTEEVNALQLGHSNAGVYSLVGPLLYVIHPGVLTWLS